MRLTSAALVQVIFAAPKPRSSGPARSSDENAGHRLAAQETERALVARVRLGDPAAFRIIMEQHFEQAARLAYTFVHERDLAEDIAQSVFARIWDRHSQWEPRISVRAYLLGAVRHRALNEVKHQNVEARYAAEQVVGSEASTSNVVERLDRITRLTALYAAIADLPERRRVALMLRFEMELSYAEIGSSLGISANAAKELIVRTVHALRARLRALR